MESNVYGDAEFLTSEEQPNTEQRILHDAWLISHGARISEFGQLMVTYAQYQELAGKDVFSEQRSAWLNLSIEDLLPGSITHTSVRVKNALLREGIQNCRDIFVAGKVKVADIRNLGSKGMDFIDVALINSFGIIWQASPTVNDIAVICNDLTEVSSIALLESSLTVAFWEKGNFERLTLSVQDMIDEGKGLSPVSKRLKNGWDRHLKDEVAEHIEEARSFAVEFYTAQFGQKSL